MADHGAFVDAASKVCDGQLKVSAFAPAMNISLTLNTCCSDNLVHFIGRDSMNDVRQVEDDRQERRKLKIAVGNLVKRPVAFNVQDGSQVDLEDLIDEAAAMTEVAAEAQGLARRCARDGKLDGKERQAMRRSAAKVRDQVAGFLTVAEGVAA